MKKLRGLRLDHLHRWLLGLPWVVERPGMADAPQLHWFGLDCPPLGIRRLWLLTGTLGDFRTEELGVLVVLPTPAGRHIVERSDGNLVAAMGGEDSLISLRLGRWHLVDEERIQRTLLFAYDACFVEPASGCSRPPCR